MSRQDQQCNKIVWVFTAGWERRPDVPGIPGLEDLPEQGCKEDSRSRRMAAESADCCAAQHSGHKLPSRSCVLRLGQTSRGGGKQIAAFHCYSTVNREIVQDRFGERYYPGVSK